MAEPINLRAARKARERAKDRTAGDENAVKFGRSKGQKAKEAQEAARAQARLDGAERSKP
jgi:hypothetical protein